MDSMNNTTFPSPVPTIPPPIWGHFTAGVCFLAFGLFLTGLALVRLRRIILLHPTKNSDDAKEDAITGEDIAKLFLTNHVPEQNNVVLQRVSMALIPTTIFGFFYEGFGVCFYDHMLHPNYSVFHYQTHMSATLLACLAGWTGFLESYFQALPQDSFRGALVFGLLGEVILWLDHASSKHDPVNGHLHAFLALISFLSAMAMGSSMTMRGSKNATTALVMYFGGFVGLAWQGVWFLVVSYHLKWNLSSAEHVTVLFVLVATGFVVAIQFVTIYMNYLLRWRHGSSPSTLSKQLDEEYAPLQMTEVH